MSRLERLLTLLGNGSSPAIRKAAAQQIGEIQKLYPYDLQALLEKVQVYLTSKDWDTRIAAGQAIEAIANNVPIWEPLGIPKPLDECGNEISEVEWLKEAEEQLADLQFKTFDVNKVISFGEPLVASGGQEYDGSIFDDEDGDNSNKDPKEILKKQKQRLKKRLGLDSLPGMDGEDLLNDIDEDDILVNKKGQKKGIIKKEPEKPKEDIATILDTTGMSARERNKAKRKAKIVLKEKDTPKNTKRFKDSSSNSIQLNNNNNNNNNTNNNKTKQHVTEQPQNSDKIVIESVLDVDKAYNQNEWPFTTIYNDLIIDLFSPIWEIRHGASVGLRELCKKHGNGGGKTIKTPTDKLEFVNIKWLEDFSLRLLCVIALDRFGDFGSDLVIAPVRETCTQTLGIVIKFMNKDSVMSVLDILLQLQSHKQWEVRHGGLLGIKYLVAVRLDLVEFILPKILPSITLGLMDSDDDVRATASETFHPVTEKLVERHPDKLPEIISILWDILLDLDDLAVSTGSVLNLLSTFYSNPQILSSDQNSGVNSLESSKLAHLVPRLYPFFRHNLYSVRLSTIKTVERLINATPPNLKSHWLLSILSDLMRFVFQNILLEEKEDIVELSLQAWKALIKSFPPNVIKNACVTFIPQWIQLLSTPLGSPINISLLIEIPTNKLMGGTTTTTTNNRKLPVGSSGGGGMTKLNISSENYLSTKSKIIGATAVGMIIRIWPIEYQTEIQDIFRSLLYSNSGILKHLSAMILSEANNIVDNATPLFQFQNPEIYLYLETVLDKPATPQYFLEALSIIKGKLSQDSKILSESLLNIGLDFSGVEILVIWKNKEIPLEMILGYSIELVTNVYDFCLNYIKQVNAPKNKIQEIIDGLDARKKQVLVDIGFIDKIQKEYQTQVQSEVSSFLISSNQIPSKLSPLVVSLLHSIRNEEIYLYQTRSSQALAKLVELSLQRTPCPNPKIIKNMFDVLCQDRIETPLCFVNDTTTTTTDMEIYQPNYTNISDGDKLLMIGRIGSVTFFRGLCNRFKSNLFKDVPSLYDLIFNGNLIKNYSLPFSEYITLNDRVQGVIDELQLLRTILPELDLSLHPVILPILPVIFHYIKLPNTKVQWMASKCISKLCQVMTLDCMHYLIRHLLPLLGDTTSLPNRFGAIQTIHQIITEMDLQLLPYVVFLTIPILGCMSDQDLSQRRLATTCFAKLVKLMPLEKGVNDPVGLDMELVQQKQDERKFLEQLLDGSKVENYPLPIRINTELRKYQQDGVNWLAFLNKYKLHGILCDDMGLGKTLQTICIMAGDDYHRRQMFAEKRTVDYQPLPNLVLCPPTLVGHWFYEIKKFCSDDTMKPMTYMGNPSERALQRQKFSSHNVLIMSYEIMRNDIEILEKLHFNYCILDEGHIIKNAKTKSTQAVKRIKSNHRLILSGTPIQNNVLELWSLFDFLMPGFLGSEKMFNDLYSKPILASKDPKSSQKDQEAGVMAMEALHRQVLPFLLRRLKEDVLADLPPKIIQDRYCSLSPLQVRLYDSFSKTTTTNSIKDSIIKEEEEDDDQDDSKIKTNGAQEGPVLHIFQALQYLRKLCGHPSFVLNTTHPQYSSILKEFKLTANDLSDINHSPKLISLKELLLECGIGKEKDEIPSGGIKKEKAEDVLIESDINQHRALIFAQSKAMLDIIENELFKKHLPSISYLRMDGTIDSMKRHNIVNRFNTDPTIDVLLLTTSVGGLGLNLTGADTVIFMEHDWNPMKDLQAMDRAHRIGQKKVVNVYRLITSGTLEEKIMGLQKFKLNIANTVINQDNSSIKTMSTNELLNLFDYNDSNGNGNNQNQNHFETSLISGTVEDVKQSKSGGSGGKLKNILESLGNLWDESQYTDEFNLNNFIDQLNPK